MDALGTELQAPLEPSDGVVRRARTTDGDALAPDIVGSFLAGYRDARVEELRIQLVTAQKEIKVLKEEADIVFDAGYEAAKESVSEWLEAP